VLREIQELRQLASWGNLELPSRLVLLRYMTRSTLECKPVVEEAEKVSREHEAAVAALEKKRRELIEEAEKDIKAVGRRPKGPPGSSPVIAEPFVPLEPEEIAARRAKIAAAFEEADQEAFAVFAKRDTADLGVRIRPLGQDRFRRLYWRLPFERQILVERTSETDPTIPLEIVPPPKTPNNLIDDEPDVRPTRGRRGAAVTTPAAVVPPPAVPQQRVVGFIAADQLAAFIQSLDVRGKRESQLKAALEPCIAFLSTIKLPEETGRITRSRAAAQGYVNRLKAE
jgi:hypothetical protein